MQVADKTSEALSECFEIFQSLLRNKWLKTYAPKSSSFVEKQLCLSSCVINTEVTYQLCRNWGFVFIMKKNVQPPTHPHSSCIALEKSSKSRQTYGFIQTVITYGLSARDSRP